LGWGEVLREEARIVTRCGRVLPGIKQLEVSGGDGV
jgi:hypothetical protein